MSDHSESGANSFYALAQAANDGIITADAADLIAYANPAAHYIFGYGAGEMIGLRLQDLMPERFKAQHGIGVMRYLTTGEAKLIGHTVELAGLRKDGSEFPLELSLAVSHANNAAQFISIIRDITERREAQELLQREIASVQLLEAVAVAANEGIDVRDVMKFCLDRVCCHLDWPVGHAYEVLHGGKGIYLTSTAIWKMDNALALEPFVEATSHTELLPGAGLPGRVYQTGKPAWIVDVTGDANFPRAAAAREAGLHAAFGFPVLAGSEVIAILEFFSRQAVAPNDYILRLMAYVGAQVGRVVERERANNEMRLLNQRLEERVETRTAELMLLNDELKTARDIAVEASHAKSSFLANMSHELRTPLTAILGYADLLQEEVSSHGDGQAQHDLKRIKAAGTHLLSLINDILDISKIEAGKVEFYVESFTLQPLIDEIVQTVMPLMDNNQNQVKIGKVCQLTMKSDRTKVRQILYNLLSNAGKFTENGVVTLECNGPDPGEAEIVRFQITDTGIGMNNEQVQKLFTKFQQLDTSPTRKYGGTGLGLAITRSLCEIMGGNISVTSQPGAGSSFIVELPRSLENAQPEPSEQV